ERPFEICDVAFRRWLFGKSTAGGVRSKHKIAWIFGGKSMSEQAVRTRAGGRDARRTLRNAPDFAMLPALHRKLPVTQLMDEEHGAKIDKASMAILEEVGVVFRDAIALEQWKQAGADVRGDRVHLDRHLIRELISTIPSGWTYRARNPEKSLPF